MRSNSNEPESFYLAGDFLNAYVLGGGVYGMGLVTSPIFVSRMNLYVALTTAAIAAQSIQNDLFSILFCIGIGADVIAGFFTKEPEVRELAVFSIRCMATGLVLDIPTLLLSYYLQGINECVLVNALNIAGLFVPVLTAFVMGMNFGSKGVMLSILLRQ